MLVTITSTKNMLMIKPSQRANSRRRCSGGFSLVEVALALAIMAFASASIISLIPFGLTSFRQAMNYTVESEIVQSLTNDITLTDFAYLKNMGKSKNVTYYFDADGNRLTSSTGANYTVQIGFTDLSPGSANTANPLTSLSNNSGATALITITKRDNTKDYFSVMVGNNQQIVSGSDAVNW